MGRTYLNVPYGEKETAKKLGARWDGRIKKWYIPAYENVKSYYRFRHWFLGERSTIVLVRDGICLMESKRKCWKCGRETPLVALALTTFAEFEMDDGEWYVSDKMEPTLTGNLTLAWAPDEASVPPRLMDFLKRQYNVKDGYSKTVGKCLANHCAYCGAIQGNHYLFEEPDSPFWPGGASFDEYLSKMLKLKMYFIAVNDNLLLDWDLYCSFKESEYPDAKKCGLLNIGGLPISDVPEYDYRVLYGID